MLIVWHSFCSSLAMRNQNTCPVNVQEVAIYITIPASPTPSAAIPLTLGSAHNSLVEVLTSSGFMEASRPRRTLGLALAVRKERLHGQVLLQISMTLAMQ